MTKADEEVSTSARQPWSAPKLWEAHSASATLAGTGGLQADSSRAVTILIDGPLPPSTNEWLQDAADRLKATPDCPARVTDAARRLEKEMAEAFLRRRSVGALGWGHIKNNLLTWGYWPRTRPPKG